MSRKNGAARAVKADEDALPKKHNYRPDDLMNVRVRLYIIKHGISFNDLCDAAIREFLSRNPKWPHRSLRLPPGKRPAS